MNKTTLITVNCTEILIDICYKRFNYDMLLVSHDFITKVPIIHDVSETHNKNKHLSCGDQKLHFNKTIELDGILTHFLVKELRISSNYRLIFVTQVKLWLNHHNRLRIKLTPPKKEIIDYAWNYRLATLVWQRSQVEHALSWLSTLGGAFSALGEYFPNYARIAGRISASQLILAVRLGDPSIASRCRLFFSLSLIQRGFLKKAKAIILHEYHNAKNSIVCDTRLIRMCFGIWAKLKFEFYLKKQRRVFLIKQKRKLLLNTYKRCIGDLV